MPASLLLTADSEAGIVTIRRCHARERLQAHVGTHGIDRALARGISPDSSVAISLRAQALIGPRVRRRFSRNLRDLIVQARAPAWPPASVPLCRLKIRASEELIERVADRLVERPVSASGVAQIHLLLSDGHSPLYNDPQGNDLQPALRAAAAALEPTNYLTPR